MSIERESGLIQEALVRRMRDASRWQGVVEAWEALLHVQMMAKSMAAEQKLLHSDGSMTATQEQHP